MLAFYCRSRSSSGKWETSKPEKCDGNKEAWFSGNWEVPIPWELEHDGHPEVCCWRRQKIFSMSVRATPLLCGRAERNHVQSLSLSTFCLCWKKDLLHLQLLSTSGYFTCCSAWNVVEAFFLNCLTLQPTHHLLNEFLLDLLQGPACL